jgi:hypothetical protein
MQNLNVRELIDAVIELEAARDEEVQFTADNGMLGDMWTDLTTKEHDHILDKIATCRDRVQKLVREITGDESLEV